MAAESPQKPATGGEYLDAVIECIGDDDLARRVDGDTARPVELTITLAESAPGAGKRAGTAESRRGSTSLGLATRATAPPEASFVATGPCRTSRLQQRGAPVISCHPS